MCAGKHTAVVPFGSLLTGAGWLGKGGSLAADVLVRKEMSLSLVEPARPVDE